MSVPSRITTSTPKDPWDPPSTRADRIRRTVPFVAVLGVALALVALPPGLPDRFVGLGLAAVGFAATGLLIVFVPWERLPDWPRLGVMVAFCVNVAITREATGGGRSGFAVVLLLAVMWQSTYGSRRHLWVTVGFVFITITLPVIAIGSESYPETEWRKAALLCLVGIVVGDVVHRQVRDQRMEHWVIDTLADVRRQLQGDNPRHTVCLAALEVTGARMVTLIEPHGDAMKVTASAGIDVPPMVLDADHVPDPVRQAAETGQRVVVADATEGHNTNASAVLGVKGWVHEPVLIGDGVMAVLSIAFTERVDRVAPRVDMAAPLVALQAAGAIDRAELVQRLDTMAHRDPLTGLLNRRAWDDVVVRELARAARTGRPVSIAVLDLDRFKSFNDAHGHLVGDQLLKAAASAWADALRACDLLARWGGEEFAVLMPETEETEAEIVLGRMAAVTPMDQTFSAGLVTTATDLGPAALMGIADAAVYRAKENGRGRVEVGTVPTPVAVVDAAQPSTRV